MDSFLEAKVADYMTRAVVSVRPETTVRALEDLLADHDFNALPVLDGDALVGIVTKLDVLRTFIFTPEHMMPAYATLSRLPAREIMTRHVFTFGPDEPLTRVLQALVESHARSFPVLDGSRLVGMISRADVVRALRDARV